LVFSETSFGADNPAGLVLILHPTDKEKRFLARFNIKIINADVANFLLAAKA